MRDPDWSQIVRESPGLTIDDVRLFGEGWCSRVYLVNGALVFRCSKHADHRPELDREIAFLKWAAGRLPLAVPEYEIVVAHSAAVPHGYAAYRFLPGAPLDLGGMTATTRSAAADRIAGFLATLHALEPPPDIRRRLPCEGAHPAAAENRDLMERFVAPALGARETGRLREIYARYEGDPGNFAFEPRVIHADLSRDHLVAAGGIVTGVLDFGDVNLWDPDYDFHYLFTDFGERFTREVAARYGHPDLDRLMGKVRYFALADQIGTIAEPAGRPLPGQVAAAWRRLHDLV